MPSFRKPSAAETAALRSRRDGDRAQLAREYDNYMADFNAGDHGRADLRDGEERDTVRRELQAAAERRGLVLRFRPGRGPLTFRVDHLPVSETIPAPAAPEPAPSRTEQAQEVQPPAPPAQLDAAPTTARQPDRPPHEQPSSQPARRQKPAAARDDRRDGTPARRPPVADQDRRKAPSSPARARRDDEPRDGTSRRQGRQRQTGSGRYDAVLPRWMREGQQPSQRPAGKRRGKTSK